MHILYLALIVKQNRLKSGNLKHYIIKSIMLNEYIIWFCHSNLELALLLCTRSFLKAVIIVTTFTQSQIPFIRFFYHLFLFFPLSNKNLASLAESSIAIRHERKV